MKLQFLLLLTVLSFSSIFAQTATSPKDSLPKSPSKHWYDKISLRGYVQLRYNRLLETNPNLGCEQCDRSWGNNNGFSIRRARMIFSGNPHERIYMYVQLDLANTVSSTAIHFVQIRDAYFDFHLDKKKEYRFRFGQSKVPYGFENMQSSQNRLALDRTDAINSALANERDLGVFFYWAPAKIRERFAYLVSSGLKGSGDYGVFGTGIYNGQIANRAELNNNLHAVARITYPFELKTKNKQIIEASLQAYTGQYTIAKNAKTTGETLHLDQRVAGSFVVYPQPLGFQAEYNIGKGPEFTPTDTTIYVKNLQGGYAQVMYMQKIKKQLLFPFVRYHFYQGGKKHEIDARSYSVNEWEMGAEWQPIPNFEVVAMYVISKRRYEDFNALNNLQQGRLLRIQTQFNF